MGVNIGGKKLTTTTEPRVIYFDLAKDAEKLI